MPPQAVEAYQRTLTRVQVATLAVVRAKWRTMGPDFDPGWAKIAPDLVTLVSAAQLAAAQAAHGYVPALLEETGQPDEPEAAVQPRAFAGIAADGRSLGGLLRSAVVHAKDASGRGYTASEALDVGGSWLDGLTQTAIADAGRSATQAEVAVRPQTGYIRQVVPDCCGRCAVLAGRWYAYDAGFARHPRCRCFAVPASSSSRASSVAASRDQRDRLFSSGQVRGLTADQSSRIAGGEDPVKVINADRDMWRARVAEQRAADTAAAEAQVVRPGVEDLFARLNSRVEALNALRSYGYAA